MINHITNKELLEAIALHNKGKDNWTEEEKSRATTLLAKAILAHNKSLVQDYIEMQRLIHTLNQ